MIYVCQLLFTIRLHQMSVNYFSRKLSAFQFASYSHFYMKVRRTFQLVVKVLQQNSDDLNDREDKGAKSQSPCVIPTTTDRGSQSASNTSGPSQEGETALIPVVKEVS